jgi:hypothetical protein
MADGTRRPVRSNDEKRFEEKRGLSNRIDPDGMPVDRQHPIYGPDYDLP